MTCPICRQPAEPRYRPFCSRRCADIDLGRWISGAYALPDDTDPAGEAPPRADDPEGDD